MLNVLVVVVLDDGDVVPFLARFRGVVVVVVAAAAVADSLASSSNNDDAIMVVNVDFVVVVFFLLLLLLLLLSSSFSSVAAGVLSAATFLFVGAFPAADRAKSLDNEFQKDEEEPKVSKN